MAATEESEVCWSSQATLVIRSHRPGGLSDAILKATLDSVCEEGSAQALGSLLLCPQQGQELDQSSLLLEGHQPHQGTPLSGPHLSLKTTQSLRGTHSWGQGFWRCGSCEGQGSAQAFGRDISNHPVTENEDNGQGPG